MKTRRTRPEEEVILEKLKRLRVKILKENKALLALINAISGEASNHSKQLTKKSQL